jgi:peroxiredoxin family protein
MSLAFDKLLDARGLNCPMPLVDARKDKQLAGKTLSQKMMTIMTPGSSEKLPVSQMNYFGVGAKMLRSMMKQKNVSSLEEMISLARELGVRMIACEMSRDLMGIK